MLFLGKTIGLPKKSLHFEKRGVVVLGLGISGLSLAGLLLFDVLLFIEEAGEEASFTSAPKQVEFSKEDVAEVIEVLRLREVQFNSILGTIEVMATSTAIDKKKK